MGIHASGHPGIREAFSPVEEVLREIFLPSLFQGLGEGTTGRGVTYLPVQQAKMSLPDPTNTAPENWMASCVISGHLVAALRGKEELQTVDHFRTAVLPSRSQD